MFYSSPDKTTQLVFWYGEEEAVMLFLIKEFLIILEKVTMRLVPMLIFCDICITDVSNFGSNKTIDR